MASNVYVINGNNNVVYSTQGWDDCHPIYDPGVTRQRMFNTALRECS